VHASWLNQIELYFSIVQRKVLTPTTSPTWARSPSGCFGFQLRYQQTAMPFDWRFTRTALDRLLRRLDDHEHLARVA
jgi:hypothetical protein